MKPRCLVIDDEPSIRIVLSDTLRDEGYDVREAADGLKGLAAAREFCPQVVLLDIRMPGLDGLEVLDKLLAADPSCRVIMLTAHGNLRLAVETMARGAYHYLAKPFDLDEVLLVVQRAAREWELSNQVSVLRQQLLERIGLDDMVGGSPAMERVFKIILQAAPTGADILLTGESGTGKELAARAIHKHSGRQGEFVAVNCAALPGNLLESELFGHTKGAFTGANQERKGHLERAQGGTLFLDEVGEIPPELQAKLLRALQEKQFFPVGAEKEVSSDFRVVAATNADLEKEVKEGRFRSDLYYRLAVIQVVLPPLRQRREDIPGLANGFLADFNAAYGRKLTLSPQTVAWLMAQPWPGNIRQLKNAIHQAVILAEGDRLVPGDFSLEVGQDGPETLDAFLRQAERTHIQETLNRFQGNRTKAADALGITRKTLYNKLSSLGIE